MRLGFINNWWAERSWGRGAALAPAPDRTETQESFSNFLSPFDRVGSNTNIHEAIHDFMFKKSVAASRVQEAGRCARAAEGRHPNPTPEQVCASTLVQIIPIAMIPTHTSLDFVKIPLHHVTFPHSGTESTGNLHFNRDYKFEVYLGVTLTGLMAEQYFFLTRKVRCTIIMAVRKLDFCKHFCVRKYNSWRLLSYYVLNYIKFRLFYLQKNAILL